MQNEKAIDAESNSGALVYSPSALGNELIKRTWCSKVEVYVDDVSFLVFITKEGTKYVLDFNKILEDYGIKQEQ